MGNESLAPAADRDDDASSAEAALINRLRAHLPCVEWPLHLPWIDAIRTLKRARGARIFAHSYQSPEIFHGVADVTGDSLALAQAAADCDAEVIVLCGVYFMAETAKVLAPDKTVLIPDRDAGCSLASAISADDVLALRAQYPGVPVVSYVNTTAAVKAVSDACCTSANALRVVEAMNSPRVIFVPDRFLGAHVASQTNVQLILWPGACEVHERFTATDARFARSRFDARLLAHPECPPEVLAEADFVGSTSAMARWLANIRPARVALITECAMADNLRATFPEIEFVQPCNLCPHMKRITLPNIHACLQTLAPEVTVPVGVAADARRALKAMLEIGRCERV